MNNNSSVIADAEHAPPGETIAISELLLPRAIELARFVEDERTAYFSLVECRRNGNNEVLVVEVEPEVPQKPANDIRRLEKIFVEFDHEDRRQPRVTAARRSFPRVIHTNVGLKDWPVDLCLFDRPFDEQKINWTAAKFAAQLHHWLSRTARGDLHDPEQPLEQLFIGTSDRLILPSSCFEPVDRNDEKVLEVHRIGGHEEAMILLAQQVPHVKDRNAQPAFALLVFEVESRIHSRMEFQPRTLAELDHYASHGGTKFIERLSDKLRSLQDKGTIDLKLPLMLVIWFPLSRDTKSKPESIDVWAFGTGQSALEVGASIGLWGGSTDTRGGVLLSRDTTKTGEDVELVMLKPSSILTQNDGAKCNGSQPCNRKYVSVGAGALGSQVLELLVRGGHGTWTLIDNDILMPHNVARHVLTGWSLGQPKSEALSYHLNSIYEDEPTRAIVANVILDQTEELTEAFSEADVIVDLSASVAASRRLAVDVVSNTRRVASFLSPSGTDSVFLAEPLDRSYRLDLLEMDYYRSLILDPDLADHLQSSGEKYRYANSCRDVSVQLPHDSVVLHSVLASKQIKLLGPLAVAKIFRSDDDLLASCINVNLGGFHRLTVTDWTIFISDPVLRALSAERLRLLPKETGGVILGTFDVSRRILYVVHDLPAPDDSQRQPTTFMRGQNGLAEKVAEIGELTKGQIGYVGEWHSHPGQSTRPSTKDHKLFEWLKELRHNDGVPAVMAIVGEESSRWIVGDIANGTESKNASRFANA